MIISIELNAAAGVTIKRYKAPKGFMYKIFDIHFSVISAGADALVVDYLIEEDTSLISRTRHEGVLSLMNLTIAGQAEDFSFNKGELSKFLCVGLDSASGTCFVIIHYELIAASKIRLLTEWFRKGI